MTRRSTQGVTPVPRGACSSTSARVSTVLIIRDDSDADGTFARIAKAGNIPLVTFASLPELLAPMKAMFPGS